MIFTDRGTSHPNRDVEPFKLINTLSQEASSDLICGHLSCVMHFLSNMENMYFDHFFKHLKIYFTIFYAFAQMNESFQSHAEAM